MQISIITIVKGRYAQVQNQIKSIEAQDRTPHEHIIICLDRPAISATKTTKVIDASGMNSLAARQIGAEHSTGDVLLFLDADCIVTPTLLRTVKRYHQPDTVLMPYPLYLPSTPTDMNYDDILEEAIEHPDRQYFPAPEPVSHTEFWSLAFSIDRAAFFDCVEFNDSYEGDGREDEELGTALHEHCDIKFALIPDAVLHQHNESFVHHNADMADTGYDDEWLQGLNEWPMNKIIRAFESNRLVESAARRSYKATPYSILRR
jgi:glycosyltransferase involved in cell wall biosynthesis